MRVGTEQRAARSRCKGGSWTRCARASIRQRGNQLDRRAQRDRARRARSLRGDSPRTRAWSPPAPARRRAGPGSSAGRRRPATSGASRISSSTICPRAGRTGRAFERGPLPPSVDQLPAATTTWAAAMREPSSSTTPQRARPLRRPRERRLPSETRAPRSRRDVQRFEQKGGSMRASSGNRTPPRTGASGARGLAAAPSRMLTCAVPRSFAMPLRRQLLAPAALVEGHAHTPERR